MSCELQPARASYLRVHSSLKHCHHWNEGTRGKLHAHVQHLSGQWRTRRVHQMQSINEYRVQNLTLENR